MKEKETGVYLDDLSEKEREKGGRCLLISKEGHTSITELTAFLGKQARCFVFSFQINELNPSPEFNESTPQPGNRIINNNGKIQERLVSQRVC